MRTRKRKNKREKQIQSAVNDLGKEEDMGEVKAEGKERTDTFDIRLGLEPQS